MVRWRWKRRKVRARCASTSGSILAAAWVTVSRSRLSRDIFGDLLVTLAANGLGILLVEHDVALAGKPLHAHN